MGGAQGTARRDPIAELERHREVLVGQQLDTRRRMASARAQGREQAALGNRGDALELARHVSVLERQGEHLAGVITNLDGARVSIENKRLAADTVKVMTMALGALRTGMGDAVTAVDAADGLEEVADDVRDSMAALSFGRSTANEDDLLRILGIDEAAAPGATVEACEALPSVPRECADDRFLAMSAQRACLYPAVPTHDPRRTPSPPPLPHLHVALSTHPALAM